MMVKIFVVLCYYKELKIDDFDEVSEMFVI